MKEPKINTIFHGNCDPEIAHHSEGGYTLTIPLPGKKDFNREAKCELDQVQMKAFGMIVQDALDHQDIIDKHTREENDGRTENKES